MARYYIDHAPAMATPAVHGRGDLACQDPRVDPEWFYPGRGGSAARAVEVCQRCPALSQCRDWALETGQQFGVWGGTTAEHREQLGAFSTGTGWPT